uniref:PLAT domain-containing protein n=1 Tax=Macrostomum lignano TaxID=282301 RepID=A0A1I8FP95_9PLAT
TVQLSRADVLRTWQPSGAHCRSWWESRQSETNRFPAAVRSGPRWLVMQLRQPMMLEAMAKWLAAAPVGSPVSAVGASQPPAGAAAGGIRAARQLGTFGSSDGGGSSENQKQKSCELVGEDGPHLPSCCISCDGPNRQDLRPLRSSNASEGMIEAHYSLEAKHTHHNQKLKCSKRQGGDPADVSLSVSPSRARTDIYLGYFTGPTGTDEQSRRIHVTSHECSIWGSWLIRCSVNQSGIEYPVVETRPVLFELSTDKGSEERSQDFKAVQKSRAGK